MKKLSNFLMIIFLVVIMIIPNLSGFISMNTSEFIITDPEDDVLMMSELDQESSTTTTDQRPNVDIIEVSCDRTVGSTEVTVTIIVNSRGEIEDRNDFEDIDINDTSFTGSMVTYAIYLETKETQYDIQYVNENLTINYETGTAEVIGNELRVSFNLENVSETITNVTATTIAFDINSLTDIKYYFDVAPDESLFVAEIGSPEKGFVGGQIQFIGNCEDLLGLTMPPYTYTWDFGDGSTSTVKNPIHVYEKSGSYTVQLTIKDLNDFEATDTKEISIEIDGTLPEVSIIKPTNGLYVLNNKIRGYLFRNPLVFGNIDVFVEAIDVDSGVQSVEFYIDGILVTNDRLEPYVFYWSDQETNPLKHKYTINVTVRDHVGNTAYDEMTVWKFMNNKGDQEWDSIVPRDYSTIQGAINAADDGDSILVLSGTYMENLFVNKSILLRGENKCTTLIDGNNMNDVIYIGEGGRVNISGFTIQNAGPGDYSTIDAGIELESNNNSINNNIICNNVIGVFSIQAQHNTFKKNTFDTNMEYGMYLDTSSDHSLIIDNEFTNNVCGLRIKGSTHINVTSNIFSQNDRGMYLCCGSRLNNIYHNKFNNNAIWNANDYVGGNKWDNGYPSGGNYLDDYMGNDSYCGVDQNCSGSDGIGDTPYNKNGVEDNYPLGYFLNASDKQQ